MTDAPPQVHLSTHDVTNQPPPLANLNLYLSDRAMVDAVRREAGDWLDRRLTDLGRVAGSAEALDLGVQANRHPPEPRIFDRYGQRLDEVAFHPAYHQLMTLAMDHHIHDIAWTMPGPAPHAGHAAALAVFTQAEAGVMCPINMTYASVPALRQDEAGQGWVTKIIGGNYDPRLCPVSEKSGATIGMAMTEKQGGSDVRANTTHAVPADGGYTLMGHKWFCSAPMSDAFLTLAQLPEGLTCFLAPRVLPDGTRNRIHLMRLKEKLGNHSNASSEIEYHDAWAIRLGDPGNGIRTIIEMVHHTRLGTISATLGIMRAALSQAIHHATHRSAFQRRLIDQPAMRGVLAELQVEYEAAVALVLHVAARFDAPDGQTRAYARLCVALAKYLLTKRCPTFVAECLEVLGGAGYIEEGPMPRLYREAPLNAIWEGSGNVIALDILRTLHRVPDALEVYKEGLDAADPVLFDTISEILASSPSEAEARTVAERLALTLQRALLNRFAPPSISGGFEVMLASNGRCYGLAGPKMDVDAILSRAELS